MTRRWITEFGGFLGLRTADFVGMEGITERDMQDYEIPPFLVGAAGAGIEAHFLGQYIPWDSRRNAEVAEAAGMQTFKGAPPCASNWWAAENLDNASTGLHDWFAWLKFAYSRGCAQISVDVRAGNISREHALAWVEAYDGIFPTSYCGVDWRDVLDSIDLTIPQFRAIEKRFTNVEIDRCWQSG